MLDPITTDAVMRMFLDGLSVDEVLVALPTLERSDIETARKDAERRMEVDQKIGSQLAWRIIK